MDTLYDLLGALPRDDAEDLRAAFRKAVKGAHPDLRPGDPDAAMKFHQIVRANEILGDPEQRGAYDHLLSLARLERDGTPPHPIAAKIHRLASGVMALATACAMTTGGYLLFMHMPMALVAPSFTAVRADTVNAHEAGTHGANIDGANGYGAENNADLATRLSASIAAVSPTAALDPTMLIFSADRGPSFYQPPNNDHAFDDTALTKSTETCHAKSTIAPASKSRAAAVAAPKASPGPQPKSPIRILWPQSYAAATFQ